MSRFKFDITYIKGDLIKVTDCLSHYYKNDTVQDIHLYDEYVHADTCIDPAGEDLPTQRCKELMDHVNEMQAIHEHEHQHSKCLHKCKEQRDIEAEEMIHTEPPDSDSKLNLQEVPGESDMTLTDMLYDHPNNAKPGQLAENAFKQCIHLGYNHDKLLALVIEKPLG